MLELLGGGFAVAALPAFAQQRGRPFRVAVVNINSYAAAKHLIDALEQGLRDQGHVIGQTVIVEFQAADGNIGRFPEVAERVVRSNPDVIVTGVNAATAPVAALTRNIPIVMTLGTDVVNAGFARSLAKPGGNVTGLSVDVNAEFSGKRIELLKEIAPKTSRVGVLWEPPYRDTYKKAHDAAASALGLSTLWVEFSGDLAGDFAELGRWRADAVDLLAATRVYGRRVEVAAILAKRRLPSIYSVSELVELGGLMSYGVNLAAQYRHAARHVDKILKGARPGDLPIEAPTQFEMVINLRTAKVLGLKIPQSIRVRADRVIE